MNRYFSTEQVAAVTGIHIKRLNEWIFKELIPRPTMRKHQFKWTPVETYALKFFALLLERGFSRGTAGAFTRSFCSAANSLTKPIYHYVGFVNYATGKNIHTQTDIGANDDINGPLFLRAGAFYSAHIYYIRDMIDEVNTKLQEVSDG